MLGQSCHYSFFKSSLKTHLFRNAFTRVSEIVTLGMGWWRGGGGGGGGGGALQSMGLTGEPAVATTVSSAGRVCLC